MGRRGAWKIRVSFSAAQLSHFGGVYLFHRFFHQLQLRTYLSRRFTSVRRNNRCSTTEILFALMYPMILGLEKIEVAALLKTNGVFQYITGLPSFPNPTTLRRFLICSSPELLEVLREIHNDLRKCFLVGASPRSSHWIDFDSTAQTL